MRILLDENIPRQLKSSLAMYETYMVKDMNWRGLKNGVLLQKAEEHQFKVFITADKNLRFQQNTSALHIIIIVLNIQFLKWEHIKPLVPDIIGIISDGKSGKVYIV